MEKVKGRRGKGLYVQGGDQGQKPRIKRLPGEGFQIGRNGKTGSMVATKGNQGVYMHQ